MKIISPKLFLLPLSYSLAVLSVQAVAQEAPSEQTFETIVVVGEATNTEITPEQLESFQANDLADVFRRLSSVSVGGSLGIAQKVYIRGLEDTLLNVSVDGAPQTGTLFHHIGRVSIEPELLQKIEVQAGAGEATSGAGAIGGALRFETRDADDLLAADENFGGVLKAGYFSNNGEKLSASFFGRLSESWGLLGSYVTVDRDNMEDGDGEELFGTSAEQRLGFVKLSGALSENQHLSFSVEQRDESGDFGPRPNWPTLEGDTLFPIDAERQTIVINYHLALGDLVNLELTPYRTESNIVQNRFDRWGKYAGEVSTIGFDLRNTSVSGAHSLTYGMDYRKDTAKAKYLAPAAIWTAWAWDPTIGKVKEEGQVTGLYVQDHWQLNNNLLLSFGLRYDDYELEQTTYNNDTEDSDLSTNIGLVYDISESMSFSVGYAEAMRGKEVGDAFTIETNPASNSIDANLKAETVSNSEIGFQYNPGDFAFKAAVYQTTIDDVIYDQQGQGTFYENVGELETEGFEVSVAYQWQSIDAQLSYSNNDSELNGIAVEAYEHNGLGSSRGDTLNLSLNFAPIDSLEMGWNFSYVADLNNIEVLQRSVELGWIAETQRVDKPSYKVHDVYLRWSPMSDDSLSVNLAVQNVFDEHYRDHSSVADYSNIPGWGGVAGLYESGRDIRVSVNYRF